MEGPALAGGNVYVSAQTHVYVPDSEVWLRVWLSVCDLFSPFLKCWSLLRSMLDIVTYKNKY